MNLDSHKAFVDELTKLINKHSMDNETEMPDFILAELMYTNLIAVRNAMEDRRKWMYAEDKDVVTVDSITEAIKTIEQSYPEPVSHAKAWCSIHSCSPHDCFYEHNPTAGPGKVWE